MYLTRGDWPETMKTDTLLSKREREVVNLVVLGYSAREIAERMNVIYQCVANHLQNIYDKTGTKRTLQALVTWYFTQNFGITLNVSEMTRRLGAMCLLGLFCAFTFSGGDCERTLRRATRRVRRNKVEFLIEG